MKAGEIGTKNLKYPSFLLKEGNIDFSSNFIKVPNELIHNKDLDPIAFVVFAYIMFNKNNYNVSYLSSGDILKCYYGQMPKRKPKLVDRIVNVMFCLKDADYIDFDDIDVIYDRNLFSDSKVINIDVYDKCYPKKSYTSLYLTDYQKIMLTSKPNILDINLKMFLYICSFMDSSKKDKDKPCAFFKSLKKTAKDMGVHYNTLLEPLNFLCSEECGVLKKYRTGSNHTNIYVLNDFNADREIQKALEQIKKSKEKNNEE